MRRYQINSVNFFNYKNSKKILIATAVTIVVLFVVVLPALLLGGEAMALDTGLDDTARAAFGSIDSSTSLAKVIGQIIYAILGFLGIIFILLLIYGGFLRMTAQGDPGKIKTSYGIITSAVIGVVIILASYTITAFIIGQVEGSVGNGGGGDGGGGGFVQTGSCVVDEGPTYGKECWNNLTIDECSTTGKCSPGSGSCVSGSCTCSWNPKNCEERGFVGK